MSVVLVNDASCLIDLHKADLIGAMLSLPYRFIVPLPIRLDELLTVDTGSWAEFERQGLEVYDLAPDEVDQAIRLRRDHPALSTYDCLALATALSLNPAILLTGDRMLRTVARRKGLQTHGVLWVWDRLAARKALPRDRLKKAISIWRDDRSVFLPPAEIAKRLNAQR